jgi:predicted nucleic acid-binding protein
VLLLDNSAWSHLKSPRLSEERAAEVIAWMARGDIATSLPFLLEAGYSAQSGAEHQSMTADLEKLPNIGISSDVEERALRAQHELAKVGHHRLAPTDLIIAACAHEAGAGVLHYDHDYDIIAARTSLDFESEWLSPAGTL